MRPTTILNSTHPATAAQIEIVVLECAKNHSLTAVTGVSAGKELLRMAAPSREIEAGTLLDRRCRFDHADQQFLKRSLTEPINNLPDSFCGHGLLRGCSTVQIRASVG
jgi:hypothetical protein